MNNRYSVKKHLAFMLSLTLSLSLFISPFPNDSGRLVHAESGPADSDSADSADASMAYRKSGYDAYLSGHQDKPRPQAEIFIPAHSYDAYEGPKPEQLSDFMGYEGTSLKTEDTGSLEWNVNIENEGLYHIALTYYPIEGKSSSIEREFMVDGALPFDEARTLAFPRVWANEKDEIERDNRDNDLRPRQIEKPEWQEVLFRDQDGYYHEPYSFYFSKGEHTITLTSTREPMVIGSIKLFQQPQAPTYVEALKQYDQQGYKQTKDVFVKVQGEEARIKSSPTLYPTFDRSSPATEPSHISKLRMNTIGGYNWRMPGDWIVWEFEVPEDGLYNIGIKNKQNLLQGLFSTRKLLIDGKVPFQELEKLPFHYNDKWQIKVLGGDEPQLFYLTKGKHEIKLEVTLGDIAPLVRSVETSVLELNAIYRKILRITGPNPDPFRDYLLHKNIPDMIGIFRQQSESLYAVAAELERIAGGKSEQQAVLNTMAYQLKDMADRPETVQRRLDQFKINVGSLGTWILQVREMPLEIDYLVVASPNMNLPKAEATFLQRIWHEIGAFFYSFIEDYDSIGNVTEESKAVDVWIGTGRDQAQVLKAMIDDTFTPQTGIQVNLKLVQMDVLLPATLAKQGPDVAMQIGNDTPVNYAMRNADVDLTQFPDYEEVAARFRDSALVPYKFNGGVYALPEQQSFSMLFYRKDILEELGLQVPQTWNDVYKMIPVLQKNHMQFALPLEQDQTGIVPNATFTMFLYQNDGEFYKNDGVASDLDSEIAMNAFKRWTEFYTNYKLPIQFDFMNRFRVGEMPIGIADYTLYNGLTVSAPEIRGLWDFAPTPGIETANGEVRREVPSSGTAVVMLKNAKDKNTAWEFMKWWTNEQTQVRFGREMESLMGAAARYPTANIEALQQLPWPMRDYQSLSAQWEWVKGIPEVPGGYFTGRHLNNAFRKVTNDGKNPRDTLYDYVRNINDEIRVKRREFKLTDTIGGESP